MRHWILISLLIFGSSAADTTHHYLAAVNAETRFDSDRAKDPQRKPAEVLAFLDVQPGMDVLDMFSGGGYYTELLAHVVGDEGSVVAHSNNAYLKFVGDEFAKRHAAERMANVRVHMAENNAWQLGHEQFDFVLMALSFHDLFLVNEDWPSIDIDGFLAALHASIRPNGTVGIIDHTALPGAADDTGGTLHRIDPNRVIELMQANGFDMIAIGDHLKNADDPLNDSVFLPERRGKTDRFILQFRKR